MQSCSKKKPLQLKECIHRSAADGSQLSAGPGRYWEGLIMGGKRQGAWRAAECLQAIVTPCNRKNSSVRSANLPCARGWLNLGKSGSDLDRKAAS